MFFFCCSCFSFLNFYCGVLHRENKWRTFSEKQLRKDHDHVLSSYHYLKVHVIASECVWVNVCAHTSRCNMELLLATKEHFDCLVFGTEKRSSCSILAHLLLSHFIFSCAPLEATNYCWYIVAALCSDEERGSGQETRNGTGSRSQSALIQDLSTDNTGWQEKSKRWNKLNICLFVQPSCFSLFDVQHSRKLPDPASSSSVRPPGTRHKTTAGHQHCNFLNVQ